MWFCGFRLIIVRFFEVFQILTIKYCVFFVVYAVSSGRTGHRCDFSVV